MDAKQVVRLAKEHIRTLLDEEEITDLGLEEVEFDREERIWLVTLGFSRPWDYPRNSLSATISAPNARRSYKIVEIDDGTATVLGVRIRQLDEVSV